MVPFDPAALVHLRAVRSELAVLCDFDGTLAPIVDDPSAVTVDPTARQALLALAAQLPLVACVTGRPALQARHLLGIEGIAYTGLHGAEVLVPSAAQPITPAAFIADGDAVERIVAVAAAEPVGMAGLQVEHKGPIVALHWRTAADPVAAEARAHELAARAEAIGLRSGTGRMVLELRPSTAITKGDGIAALLAAQPAVRHAVFAGDDVTDLDGFKALRALVEGGALESATLVAVSGLDAPPQVAAGADVVLPDPAALGAFLAELAA